MRTFEPFAGNQYTGITQPTTLSRPNINCHFRILVSELGGEKQLRISSMIENKNEPLRAPLAGLRQPATKRGRHLSAQFLVRYDRRSDVVQYASATDKFFYKIAEGKLGALVAQKILQPLGMTMSGITFTQSMRGHVTPKSPSQFAKWRSMCRTS
jgi:hypothetical protein